MKKEQPKTFGQLLAHNRKRLGHTQADMAEAVGCSQSVYSEYESGKKKPSWDVAFRACDFLGIEWSEIKKIL